MGLHDPIADVDVVDVLLDVVVTREPGEEEPVVKLEFHLGQAVAGTQGPGGTAVEIASQELYLSQSAVVNARDHLLVDFVMVALQAHADLEILLSGDLVCG